MINAILPLWRKKIEVNVTKATIAENFNREIQTAYWIFAANLSDKEYYGTFLGDEIIIKKMTYTRQLFPILICKLESSQNGIIANLKIGYPYWFMIHTMIFIFLFSLISIYMPLFITAALMIFLIKDFSEFHRDAVSLLENVILVDDGLPIN